MAGEIGGLIDDRITETTLRQDRPRALAAPARVEIVAVEIEHHDSGALDLLQERIELGRVEVPAVVEIIEAAVRRRRGGDHAIDIAG